MPQYGINLDPDQHAGLPLKAQDLSGLKWVRFVFQAQPHQKRTIQQSCQFYAPLIDSYRALGIRTLLILNHQTFVGDEPWKKSGGNWRSYAADFSVICGEIARYFKDRGVAYEIWNEGDQASDSAIYVPPQTFAPLLSASSIAIKTADPTATVVFGGLVGSDPCAYLQAVASTLGRLPVDAIGVHPYGKSPSGDNGIIPYLQNIRGAFPTLPLWITEYGDGQIVKARYEVVDYYMRLVDSALRRSMASTVPVAIWYCWSDGMNPGFGITDVNRQPKDKVYSTYFLLNKLNEVMAPPSTPAPAAPAPTPPTTQPEVSTPGAQFTHQQLINAIYEAAQAVGDNPWQWFRQAALTYLTEDRKKIYSGTAIADLPNLTTEQKTLIQRALDGKPLETVNYNNGDTSTGGSPGTGTAPNQPLPAEKVLDIQWVSQFDAVGTPNTDCGDACVLMLLWYYHFKTPAARIVFKLLSGTTTAAELLYLGKEYDLILTTEPVSLDRVKELVAAGTPVIVLVDYKRLGFPVHLRSGVNQGHHWFVVVGYNAAGFVIHDPLWMPAQRNGMGGGYLPIERDTLQNALIDYYVMLYRPDETS